MSAPLVFTDYGSLIFKAIEKNMEKKMGSFDLGLNPLGPGIAALFSINQVLKTSDKHTGEEAFTFG